MTSHIQKLLSIPQIVHNTSKLKQILTKIQITITFK